MISESVVIFMHTPKYASRDEQEKLEGVMRHLWFMFHHASLQKVGLIHQYIFS